MAIAVLTEQTPGEAEISEAFANEGSGIPAWRLGRGYAALQEKGYEQKQIAKALKCSQTQVSRCVTIFMGLSVGAHERLRDLGDHGPNILKIVEVARLRDGDGNPDEARQLAALEKCVGQSITRLSWLRAMVLPAHVLPFVGPVLRYLTGESDLLTFPDCSPTEAPCPSPTSPPEPPHPRTSPTRSTGSTRRSASSGSSTRGGSRRT